MDKMEGEQHLVENEFACPGVLRGALLDLKPSVERVFRVVLRIGGEETAYTAQDGQIWLQLKGIKSDVEAAKLFVKGIVNQEAQKEMQYPEVLHCVFCGAKKFFMDCLIRMTSAHIVVGSPGCLLISGLAEPVVKAYSLIMDLVEKYRNNQVPAVGDSLDSRRGFKSLVEKLEDNYTLDLLALPVRVKEVLLDLVKQSGGDPSTLDSFSTSAVPQSSRTLLQIQEYVDRVVVGEPVAVPVDHTFAIKPNLTLPADSPPSHFLQTSKSHMYGGKTLNLNRLGDRRPEPRTEMGMKGDSRDQFFHRLVRDAGFRTRAEGAEGTSQKSEELKWFGDASGGSPSQSEDNESRTEQQEERLQSTGNKQEYEHLLKFFTAMGYDEEVVSRVLIRTGPKEPSQVLDLIQQEQDKSGTHSSAEAPDQEASLGVTRDAGLGVNGAPGTKEDDNFVLGVVKKEVLLDLVKQSGGNPSTLDSFSTSAVPQSSRTLLQIQEYVDRVVVGEPVAVPVDHTFAIKPNLTLPADSPPSHFLQTSKSHMYGGKTAMGYDEEVVSRVLIHTGPKEPSQVLDLIQQEQDKSGTHSSAEAPDQEASLGVTRDAGLGVNGAPGTKEDDDFVLGVVKKAAASCGYTEDNVATVYSNFADLNPHKLILELQKVGGKDPEIPRDPRDDERQRAEEMEEHQLLRKASVNLQKVRERELEGEKSSMTREEKPKNDRGTSLRERPQKNEGTPVKVQPWRREEPFMKPETSDWGSKPDLPSPSKIQSFPIPIPSSVRGPPQPIYPSTLPPYISDQHMMAPVEPPATKPKHKQGTPPGRTGAVVTGSQRFLEGLESPFVLQLTNDPGDPGLRQIIIDGSNVAKTLFGKLNKIAGCGKAVGEWRWAIQQSHGLGTFFSCRGIALAVQHFWSRGHRKISVFIPQWRQKRDSKIKEHHFMTQLQDLGLLSYTPSREVKGQRINSYDDRFMLQLAQKTDGVIVTNDNMRDLVDESAVWREIIKKRLLQYLFAGDNFMVPDDPLGRSGPHINDFLRAQNSPPTPGSHSFAGVASSFPPPTSQPRAHTEVLHYRERTPGGAGRPQKSGRSPSPEEKVIDRSVEVTQKLKRELVKIFPGQESVVMMMLQCHPALTDINQLSYFILEQQMGT